MFQRKKDWETTTTDEVIEKKEHFENEIQIIMKDCYGSCNSNWFCCLQLSIATSIYSTG